MSATLIGPVSKSLSIDESGNRTHTVVYEVATSATTEGPITAYTCSGLPQIGDVYNVNGEVDYEAFCCGPTGEITLSDSDASHRKWKVPVVWKTGGMPQARSPGSDQHLQIDADYWNVSLSTSFQQWVADVDIYGTPIRNSAGFRFHPMPEFPIANPTIVLEKRTSFLPLITWSNVVNSINSTTYLGLDAHWWRCARWDVSVMHRGNGQAYIQNRVELAVKVDTWLLKPVDQGFYYLDPMKPTTDDGLPNPKPIMVRGEMTAEPQPLDGNGGILPAGEDVVLLDGTHGSRDTGPFYPYKQLDFNLYFPAVLPGPFVSA